MDNWLTSFVSYVLAYKANIAKEGTYGTLFTDKEVKKIYEAFDNSHFMFSSVKHWILHGEWNIEELNSEINRIKEREKAASPSEIVRTHRVVDIDEDVLREGFPYVLKMAYSGELTLYEYVSFIMNCYWIRVYELNTTNVNWKKVINGINIQIEHLIKHNIDDSHSRASINEENKESFLEEEWAAYTIIKEFWEKDRLIFSHNKQLYLKTLNEDLSSVFIICENKLFEAFDSEMAEATVKAFAQSDNATKNRFSNEFCKMWQSYTQRPHIKIDETLIGFNKLIELLETKKKELETENKKIALIHTNKFINSVQQLIVKNDRE